MRHLSWILAVVRTLCWVGLWAALPSAAYAQQTNPKRPSKLAHVLEQTGESMQRAWERGVRDMRAFSSPVVPVSQSGEIEVLIHAGEPIDALALETLARLGARGPRAFIAPEQAELPQAHVVQVWVPFGALGELDGLPWVAAVLPAMPGLQEVRSEGVLAQGAGRARNRGFTGAGVPVGVISDGVTSLQEAQRRGELPRTVQVLDAGLGDEGTAMLEIVNDMAPRAPLLFHSGRDFVLYQNAFVRLFQSGSRVITEDISFLLEPVFQKGILATLGDALAGQGVSVHSAAGNRGAAHVARAEVRLTGTGPSAGPFVGCGDRPPTNAIVLDRAEGAPFFEVELGLGSSFILQWSEPRSIFPTAGEGGYTDLDLYIMDETGTRCFAHSVAMQGDGIGDTLEVAVTPAALAGTRAKIVVSQFGDFGAAKPPVFDLVFSGAMAISTPERLGSLAPDAQYTGDATSSAAIRMIPDVGFVLEAFSSAGPIQLGLTTLPDGSAGEVPSVGLPAPDFASLNGVSISGAGGFPLPAQCPTGRNGACLFFGTSAAAPHSAACAALVFQALGETASVPEVNAILQSTARITRFPIEAGAGFLDCDAATQEAAARRRDRTP